MSACLIVFFFQAEDGIRDYKVTGVQTCALPIYVVRSRRSPFSLAAVLLLVLWALFLCLGSPYSSKHVGQSASWVRFCGKSLRCFASRRGPEGGGNLAGNTYGGRRERVRAGALSQ